jgi:NAD(P)-dependent dehydrogenase (short-subunit alcohol dehydrogenase family)
MLAVTGYNTTIVQAMRSLLPESEPVVRIDDLDRLPQTNRFLFAGGVLIGKPLADQTASEIDRTFSVNFVQPMLACELIFACEPDARVCLIGSESGYTWSHDDTYAAAKAALHKYVETKKLLPGQQLVCVAPSIVRNSGMTERRTDIENLERRRQAHPKRRFLEAIEVARLIHFVLYVDEGYLSNTVIRMNGGGR